jgi:hypothetical protein
MMTMNTSGHMLVHRQATLAQLVGTQGALQLVGTQGALQLVGTQGALQLVGTQGALHCCLTYQ